MELVTIGRVVKPHGIDGTLKVLPLTDFPQHFKTLEEIFFVKGGAAKTSLERVRFHKGYVFLKTANCDGRTCAEEWTGADVAIDSKYLWPLKDGEYYHFQIEGIKVITEEGVYLGEVEEIIQTGSNDVYVVREGSRECLLPAIKDVIKKVDLDRKIMIVHILEGLID
ncbi:16S rRNA processing protein RimM [bacterium]|nr:16S rRNA processing protein RimM [bacterium]